MIEGDLAEAVPLLNGPNAPVVRANPVPRYRHFHIAVALVGGVPKARPLGEQVPKPGELTSAPASGIINQVDVLHSVLPYERVGEAPCTKIKNAGASRQASRAPGRPASAFALRRCRRDRCSSA